MVIRNIRGDDTDGIVALYKKTLPYLCIDRAIFMRKIFLEANFSKYGAFVAEEDGRILGFVNAVFRRVPICADSAVESDMGWLAGFIVDKSRPEAGDKLLAAAEEFLAKSGKSTVNTGYYPTYFIQGTDERYTPEYAEIFRRRGYTEKRSIAMIADLTKYVPPENLEKRRAELATEGIAITSLTDRYITELFTLENDFLGASWLYEFRNRALDMDFDRFRIAVKDGKVIGALVFGDPDSAPERFGPFGVSERFQGKGIGGILLADCFAEMKKRGLKTAWMQWASDNESASALYKKAGFVMKESYLEFEKKL